MLSINIWELLWTVVNFFVLYYLLKLLLYRPLIGFMDARQARIDTGLNEEKKVEDAIMANTALLDEEKAKCRKQSRDILGAAKSANDKRQSELIKKATEAAGSVRRGIKENVEKLRAQENERYREHENELASLLAKKILGADEKPKD
ncbi:MAG: hypothetical protein VB039_10590 [Oscillospiraceae bacterium]|nr:hypothetical protein [Oscillospiraceae bacterium]